jgi:hypothetical protein
MPTYLTISVGDRPQQASRSSPATIGWHVIQAALQALLRMPELSMDPAAARKQEGRSPRRVIPNTRKGGAPGFPPGPRGNYVSYRALERARDR